jgi:hypothetical protein
MARFLLVKKLNQPHYAPNQNQASQADANELSEIFDGHSFRLFVDSKIKALEQLYR